MSPTLTSNFLTRLQRVVQVLQIIIHVVWVSVSQIILTDLEKLIFASEASLKIPLSVSP